MSVIAPSWSLPEDYKKPRPPRPWPVYEDGKKECILLVGERWDAGYCARYQANDKHQNHCKFFKPNWRCIFEDNFFESDEELFKI